MTDLLLNAYRRLMGISYRFTVALFSPLNGILSRTRRSVTHPGSVLHVSYMVHVPYQTTRLLRRHGLKADYLAVGTSPVWNESDFRTTHTRWPFVLALQEFRLFWSVVAKYEVLHLHFAVTMTQSGWELPILKNMGRKIVIHYRGCEIRDRDRNMALHPQINICQQCDYNPYACRLPVNVRRRDLARAYGDHFIVTTPDMKDFVPDAEHLPFLAPEVSPRAPGRKRGAGKLKIVHVTLHPGIEGTADIVRAIDNLKRRGHALDFVYLRGVPHEEVLRELSDADVAIGKMKMGYYANAQIESMVMGVPTFTYVRPEFMTSELRNSGFVFTTPAELEATLEHYLNHPEELEAKRLLARASVLRLHNNDAIAARLIRIYRDVRESD